MNKLHFLTAEIAEHLVLFVQFVDRKQALSGLKLTLMVVAPPRVFEASQLPAGEEKEGVEDGKGRLGGKNCSCCTQAIVQNDFV